MAALLRSGSVCPELSWSEEEKLVQQFLMFQTSSQLLTFNLHSELENMCGLYGKYYKWGLDLVLYLLFAVDQQRNTRLIYYYVTAI